MCSFTEGGKAITKYCRRDAIKRNKGRAPTKKHGEDDTQRLQKALDIVGEFKQ